MPRARQAVIFELPDLEEGVLVVVRPASWLCTMPFPGR